MSTLTHRTEPGSSYFVTARRAPGRNVLQISDAARILAAIVHYRDADAYRLHEFVLMPNHLHSLLTPGQTTSLEKAIQLIKGTSSHEIHKRRSHKMAIWQKGFQDWTVRDFDDWPAKAKYIRMNPVRAHLDEKPADWPRSSAKGKSTLDLPPGEYQRVASAAKAASASIASGLKPRPPRRFRA
jgi:REP element-mobilizing transposase RayT